MPPSVGLLGKAAGDPGSSTVALPDLVDVLAVNPDSSASDPTVFHKRYLKKIRDLGEVRVGLGGRGGASVLPPGRRVWVVRPA